MDKHEHVQLRNSESPKDLLKGCLVKFLVDGADRFLRNGKSRSSVPIGNGFGVGGEPVPDHLVTCQAARKPVFRYPACQENNGIELRSSRGMSELFPVKLLAFVTVMVMKLVGWQFNMFVSSVTFPIRLSSCAVMFLMFPIQALKHIRGCFIRKLVRIRSHVTHTVKMKAQRTAMRFGFALFWCIYVCLTLLGLFASSFLFGGFITWRLLERPVHTTKILNFDYTQPSPVAFVPITGQGPSSKNPSNNGLGNHAALPRAIPYNRELHLTISLTMPESDYNRRLGIFQVKVELLSANGMVTSSARHPCMLKFKGQTVQFAETIIRSVPLITGLQSESQVLDVEMDEFVEGIEPTICLRVTIEQRAEHKPGTGIPEIYTASLKLESELPPLKMMIWNWRRTVFIWASILWFLAELVVILLLCRAVLIPRWSLILYGKKLTYSPSFITSRVKSSCT